LTATGPLQTGQNMAIHLRPLCLGQFGDELADGRPTARDDVIAESLDLVRLLNRRIELPGHGLQDLLRPPIELELQ
jgi:hypothetical protein